ncbi:MAG: hypothetical protein EOP84_19270 [Verrucomicrobiaceae bacterium]|nr:MAG: hypothetical protein EOP84_19270 [Verrucomicrobiaceae bacterium]
MFTGQNLHLLLRCRMAYTFEVDHDLNRSMSVITGVIKFDEAVAFIMERELFCALGYPLLVDVRSAQLSLSGRDIVRLLPHLQRLVEIAPLAPSAVVVQDKVNLRIVQLVAAMATNLCCIRSFSTTAEAEQWLGWNASSNHNSSIEEASVDQAAV